MVVAAFAVACVAAFAALGSLIASLWSVWYARGQKHAADRSADAADRSAREAKRAADAAAKVAGIEQDRRTYEVDETEREWVHFDLIRLEDSRYELRHAGTRTAYGVHVDAVGLKSAGEPTDFDKLAPGARNRYWLHGGSDFEVSWYLEPDCSDKRRSQELFPS